MRRRSGAWRTGLARARDHDAARRTGARAAGRSASRACIKRCSIAMSIARVRRPVDHLVDAASSGLRHRHGPARAPASPPADPAAAHPDGGSIPNANNRSSGIAGQPSPELIPVERLEVAEVEEQPVPLGDRPIEPRLGTELRKEPIGQAPCMVDAGESRGTESSIAWAGEATSVPAYTRHPMSRKKVVIDLDRRRASHGRAGLHRGRQPVTWPGAIGSTAGRRNCSSNGERARTWFPGVVHLRGVQIRGQNRKIQWYASLDRARVSLAVLPLFWRRFHARALVGRRTRLPHPAASRCRAARASARRELAADSRLLEPA